MGKRYARNTHPRWQPVFIIISSASSFFCLVSSKALIRFILLRSIIFRHFIVSPLVMDNPSTGGGDSHKSATAVYRSSFRWCGPCPRAFCCMWSRKSAFAPPIRDVRERRNYAYYYAYPTTTPGLSPLMEVCRWGKYAECIAKAPFAACTGFSPAQVSMNEVGQTPKFRAIEKSARSFPKQTRSNVHMRPLLL